MLLAKSTDGGQSFSSPVKVSDYYELPDCDTYQGAGADPGRACVPEKGSSNVSVFRATNYPSGQVDPTNAKRVTVAFGSYINKDSNESNGCAPSRPHPDDGNPTLHRRQDAGSVQQQDPVGRVQQRWVVVRQLDRSTRVRSALPRRSSTNRRGQNGTDQFWQWSAFTKKGQLAVDYYDRQYGHDETNGSSDFSLSGSQDLSNFGQVRVTSSSMPAPTQFGGLKGGQFYGDYIGLAALDKAHPIWSDTRSPDLFVCPGTATPARRRPCAGRRRTTARPRTTRRASPTTVSVPSSGGHGH